MISLDTLRVSDTSDEIRTSFFNALHRNNIREIIAHIEDYHFYIADIIDDNGSNIAHWCASKGQIEILAMLSRYGFELDYKNKYKLTPLSLALINGKENTIGYLIKLPNVDLNHIDIHNNSYMHLLIENRNLTSKQKYHLGKLLIEKGYKLSNQNAKVVPLLVFALQIIPPSSNQELTALILANMISQKLLCKKDLINTLRHSVLNDWSKVVKVLLSIDKGMLDNTVYESGRNILHIASQHSSNDMVDFICKSSKTLINKRDDFGFCPIHIAVLSNKFNNVKALVENNVDINAPDHKGNIPLIQAIKVGSKEIFDLLLLKTDTAKLSEIVDSHGNSILMVAVLYASSYIRHKVPIKREELEKRVYFVKELLKHPIDLGHKNNKGFTVDDLSKDTITQTIVSSYKFSLSARFKP